MIRAAKAKGSVPVIGTLTPVNGRHDHLSDDVANLNGMIRSLASSEGARLADLERAF
jgi:hypothetical protein